MNFICKSLRKSLSSKILSLVNRTDVSKFGLKWNLKDVKLSKKNVPVVSGNIFSEFIYKNWLLDWRLKKRKYLCGHYILCQMSARSFLTQQLLPKWKLRRYELLFIDLFCQKLFANEYNNKWIILKNRWQLTILNNFSNKYMYMKLINQFLYGFLFKYWLNSWPKTEEFLKTRIDNTSVFCRSAKTVRRECFWAG